MTGHPYRDVVIAAVHNTAQARQLPEHTSLTIALEAALGVIDAAGIEASEIDGVLGQFNVDLTHLLGLMPAWAPTGGMGGIPEILAAADAIALGHCSTVLIAGGGAGVYRDRSATAPWTRVSSEFVLPFGVYTALEFALIARRHMHMYGTTSEQMAHVAATIRNNGHVNPEAIYFNRGPFTSADVLASRMVADPFHLLDCSLTGEGGCARFVLTTAERAKDLSCTPVYILGGGIDHNGPSYQHPPSWDLRGNRSDAVENGYVGQRAAERAFAMSGLRPDDVDVAELYDPFSFEIIRQLEAFGFCKRGEGGDFATSGALEPGGALPITTDGGLMSFSHGGGSVQLLQRVIRGVQQLQGGCATMQVPSAEVAIASNGGAGALFNDVILLGSGRP